MPLRLIRDRSTWFLSAGFVLLAVLFVGAFSVASGQQRDSRMVAHTLEVQNRLSRALSTLQDAETGERGYLITGRPEFLEPHASALASIEGELDGLAAAVRDNPLQTAAVGRLRGRANRFLATLSGEIALRREGRAQQSIERVASGKGKAQMDAIRTEIASMRQEESRLLALRQSKARSGVLVMRVTLGIGFLLLLTLMVLAVRDSMRRLADVSASRDSLAAANVRLITESRIREEAEAQVRQLQKTEALGQLTGGIAHDFNNMLSVIIGNLDLAVRRFRRDPDRAEANIRNATAGAQRAAALTSRLLAFSRQQPLAPVAADPNRLVGGMSEMLRRTIGEHLRVETVLAGGVWRIHADVSQLENALLNLCVNARDAMPDGGALTIETTNAHLDEEYAASHSEVRPGQYVMISVSDTGEGMTPEVIKRAFDPFYTTKEVGKGTGLGLSQVYGFVKQSGGHVKIYSEPGRGTVVKIYLPRWMGDAATPAETAPAPEPPAAAAGEIVLVVEDDAEVRRVSVDSLRSLGYVVLHAGSAEEALDVLDAHPRVDLLFTDIVMPGATGRALADAAVAKRRDLKVLYTTGYTRNAVVHNGVLDAGVAFLPKPFTVDQLALKVRQALDGQGANRPV